MYNQLSAEPISTDAPASYCVRHTAVTVRCDAHAISMGAPATGLAQLTVASLGEPRNASSLADYAADRRTNEHYVADAPLHTESR